MHSKIFPWGTSFLLFCFIEKDLLHLCLLFALDLRIQIEQEMDLHECLTPFDK